MSIWPPPPSPPRTGVLDQIERIRAASGRGFDVIGVDVADVGALTPVINELTAAGHRVMTFSSSDASREDGCSRIAYVGNTHNFKDGADLTRALCQRIEYRGKVGVLW